MNHSLIITTSILLLTTSFAAAGAIGITTREPAGVPFDVNQYVNQYSGSIPVPGIAEERTALPCGQADLHIVIVGYGDADLIGPLLWEAGIPAGSQAHFYWGEDRQDAIDRATRASVGEVILAPETPSLTWAMSLLCT